MLAAPPGNLIAELVAAPREPAPQRRDGFGLGPITRAGYYPGR